ncbi:MAG: HlyD family efflux transporter periplasmic adaptor subunit [Acidobacteria bacterium]|nr:HlyD family efflux transporter periplasmic adaptor subunit [Acidobacteriota bacterium]
MSALGQPNFSPTPVPPPALAPVPAPEATPPSRRPWSWYIVIAAVLTAVGGWLALGDRQTAEQKQAAAAQSAVKTAKVTQGSLVQTVRVSGVTASRAFVNVTAPIVRSPESGRDMVLLYLVQSGARVKKGELVGQIDAKSIEDHLEDVKDDIEQSLADIRKRKAEQAIDLENLNQTIRAAKAEFEKARLEAKAAEVRTDVERELLKLTAEEAEARYKQVQADVAQKQAVYAAEIRTLGITHTRHERHYGRHAEDLKRFKIYSPMDGLAVVQPTFRGGEMAPIQQGDIVMAGQLFMKVVDPTKMSIEGNINQTESSAFRIGQKASIEFDAFPGLKLNGSVYSIGALATKGWRENYYIRNLPVRVHMDVTDPKVIPDLSAAADVVTGRVENAKLVPLGAVKTEDGKEVVYVRAAEGFDKRVVTVGERNNTHAVVKAGLEVGDEVALDKPAVNNATVARL